MPSTTQFYHTRDPIENLRVRVTARKVQHGGHHRTIAVGTSWSCCFQWQEKWAASHSSAATNNPSHKAKKKKTKENEGDSSGQSTTQAIVHGEREHDGVALVSYTDADTLKSSAKHLVTRPNDQQQLSHPAIPAPIAPSRSTSHSSRVESRERREETFRQMHLVLHLSDGHNKTEDLVLASLRYYPFTGLLCSTPPFSACLVEETNQDSQPRLTTYRVISQATGEQFEYALDNENDLFPAAYPDDQQLLSELLRQERNEEQATVLERQNKEGEGTIDKRAMERQPKRDDHDRLQVLVEIVSVKGALPSHPLRAEMTVASMEDAGWQLQQGHRSSRSRLARPAPHDTGEDTATFAHHNQLSFLRSRVRNSESTATGDDTPVASAPPHVRLNIVKVDSWKRERLVGCADLQLPVEPGYRDTEVSLWRPRMSTHDQLDEFFLGNEPGDPHLGTVAAVHTPGRKTTLSTRFGMQTVSVQARVRVRFHTIRWVPVKDPMEKALPPVAAMVKAGRAGPGAVVKRSVEEILQSVKLSRRDSGGLLPPVPSTTSSAVLELLARVKGQVNRDASSSAS